MQAAAALGLGAVVAVTGVGSAVAGEDLRSSVALSLAAAVASPAGSETAAPEPAASEAAAAPTADAAPTGTDPDARPADTEAAAADAAAADRERAAAEAEAAAAAERAAADEAAAAEERAAAEAAAAEAAAAAVPVDDPAAAKAFAAGALAGYGWDASQMTCLDTLWTKESEWLTSATNAGSGAYGIAQSLPGDKMASTGSDWRTNPQTQIRWGLTYIQSRYGSPCSALNFHYANNWY